MGNDMNQNKTLTNKLVRGLLAIVMTFTSSIGYSAVEFTSTNVRYLQSPQPKYVSVTEITPNSPHLKDNLWITYLFPGENRAMVPTMKALQNAPSPMELKAEWAKTPNGKVYKKKLTGRTALLNKNRQGNYTIEMEIQRASQDFLNIIYRDGPDLAKLLNEDKFDEAFVYADQKKLMMLITMPTGMMALGVQPFSEDRMIRFYEAGHRNYALMKRHGMPYSPKIWDSGSIAEFRQSAIKNYNDEDSQKYPNIAWFRSKVEKDSFIDKLMTKVVMPVVVGIVTAGAGTLIAGGVAGAFGTGVTYAANGTILTGTIGGVSIASGTVGGTVLTAASTAVAGAAVGAAQGQNFGDALASGLLGSAVGLAVGAGVGATGFNGAVADAVGNQAVADYVTATAVGTVSNAALNGGDLDAAFTGAATGSALGVLQNGIMNAGQGPSEPQASAEQIAQLEAWNNRNSAQVQGQLSGEIDTIVSNNVQSAGGIDFSARAQNTADWNSINNNYNNLMDNQVRQTASAPVEGIIPSDASRGLDEIDAGFVSNDPNSDPFAEIQQSIDDTNDFLREGGLLNDGSSFGLNGAGAALAVGANLFDTNINLASNPDLLYQGQIANGEYCTATSCRLINSVAGGTTDLPDLNDFLYDRQGITVVGQNGISNSFFYDDPNGPSLLENFVNTNGESFRFNFEVGDSNAIALNDALFNTGRDFTNFSNIDDVTDFISGTNNGDLFLTYINNPNGPDHLVAAQNVDGRAVFGGNYSSAGVTGPVQADLDILSRQVNIDPNLANYDLFPVNTNASTSIFSGARVLTGAGILLEGVFAADSLLNFVGSNLDQNNLDNLNNAAQTAQNNADSYSDAGSIFNGSRDAANAAIYSAGGAQAAFDYANGRAGVMTDLSNSAAGQFAAEAGTAFANSAIGQAASTVFQPIGQGLSFLGDQASQAFGSFSNWLDDYGRNVRIQNGTCQTPNCD